MSTKVLLIEDDHTMLTLLRTLLRFEGFDVLQMPPNDTLTEVMNYVRQEKPALVLLDVHLRQFNGFDLLHLIRQEQELSDMRILMSSGMDFRDRCALEGANDFILKPYMPDELIKRIRQALEDENKTNRE